MDFSKPITFAGISFKANSLGTVRWLTVKKILEKGGVECSKYECEDQLSSGYTASAQSVLDEGEVLGPSRCFMAENKEYGNPRYAYKRFLQVMFHGNLWATLYDLDDLEELADGTEVVDVTEADEACQVCVGSDCEGNPGDPPALVEKGHLRLVVYNP